MGPSFSRLYFVLRPPVPRPCQPNCGPEPLSPQKASPPAPPPPLQSGANEAQQHSQISITVATTRNRNTTGRIRLRDPTPRTPTNTPLPLYPPPSHPASPDDDIPGKAGLLLRSFFLANASSLPRQTARPKSRVPGHSCLRRCQKVLRAEKRKRCLVPSRHALRRPLLHLLVFGSAFRGPCFAAC